MKNYDLIWAREWAGLTQDQAAELMNVDRRTFGRWEAGTVPIPAKKWARFLAKAKLEKKDIPARKEYDDDGYPVGFDREPFDGPDTSDFHGIFPALRAIEGDELEGRRRERHRLALIKLYAVCRKEGLTLDTALDAEVRREMALYDARLKEDGGSDAQIAEEKRLCTEANGFVGSTAFDREILVRQDVYDNWLLHGPRRAGSSWNPAIRTLSGYIDHGVAEYNKPVSLPSKKVPTPHDDFSDLG